MCAGSWLQLPVFEYWYYCLVKPINLKFAKTIDKIKKRAILKIVNINQREEFPMDAKLGVCMQHFCNQYAQSNYSAKFRTSCVRVNAESSNVDTFEMSQPYAAESKRNVWHSNDEINRGIAQLREGLKNAVPIEMKCYSVESDTPEGWTKRNFEYLRDTKKYEEDCISKKLKEAGVPEDVTFEFDYNIDTHKTEVTKVSDEKYLDEILSVVGGGTGYGFGRLSTAYASRIMNGYISSAYYSRVSNLLRHRCGQDIKELYIDENGDLCGANASLRNVIRLSKEDRNPYLDPSLDPCSYFPFKDIEGMIKRLVSDKEITPNISHMGYEGGKIFTNDGEFKFGKDFDPDLFKNKRYLMRGSISLVFPCNYYYDKWLEDEELFK